MASLGVLAQMMMNMDPKIQPYDPLEVERQRNLVRQGRTQNETALLGLEDLKRQQAAQAQARQYYQEHPEALLGQQGQPMATLATLNQPGAGGPPGAITQQPFGPGGVGQAQAIPAYPDASRYAAVSPQGGGPLPPDVTAQVMPNAVPPQSTLGAQGGQPQAPAPQNHLMELMRRNPDAALQVLDMQTKRQTQQFNMRATVAEAIGRELHGVTDQASYDAARRTIAWISPQWASALPQVYSKEALLPYIKQAFTAKEAAELQLKTTHEQTEQLKAQAELGRYNLQAQQAGYQGLGADVTGILKGLTPEQVTEFGGRTSDKAIAYATKKVQDLALEQKEKEGLAGVQARTQGEAQARLDKTVSEAFGERTTKLYDTQTGQTIDARTKVKDYEALPAGRVKELSTNQTEQMENINTSVPVIAQLQRHIDSVYGPGGALARMTPDERADLAAAPERWAKQYAQKYPELIQAQRFIDSNAGALARALAGEKGAMAEGDVERAKAMLPSLTTSLQLWPPSKIGIQQPDTRAVALRSMNSIVDLVNGRVRTLLGNEQYTHPKLHRYETAEEAQQASGGPGTPPQVAPPELPIPPTVGLNPRLPPAPTQGPTQGAFGTPPQTRYVPPASTTQPSPPAPAPAPAPAGARPQPPTATSTPAQDEAYRQSVAPRPAPAPAPAPSSPAARTTPGRQSQAPAAAGQTRVARAGGHKFMDLADVAEAMKQTGRSRREVEEAARAKGYTVYGSKLKLPEVTMVG